MFQLQPSTSMADEASGQRRSSRARRARVSYSPETDSEFRCIFVAKTNWSAEVIAIPTTKEIRVKAGQAASGSAANTAEKDVFRDGPPGCVSQQTVDSGSCSRTLRSTSCSIQDTTPRQAMLWVRVRSRLLLHTRAMTMLTIYRLSFHCMTLTTHQVSRV